MGKYFDFALTEEQIAAYLDGMLNAEQSNMVEQMICPPSAFVSACR